MKRLLLIFALLFCLGAQGQTTYNAIATAYVTTTISQNVVFDDAMRQGGTFTFSVLAHNGGGRAGQSDTANVKIEFYNSSGGLITQAATSHNANLPNPNAICGNPCIDTSVPWTTLTVSSTLSAAQAANVAYARVSMYGIDGSYWAGDYGPWYRAPTFQLNGGSNLTYNPEFGPYNGVTAQGWTSNPGFGACQGAWGGSNACIVNSDGVPGSSTVGLVANQNGGGPSATGGTTSGQAGGYNNTMTTTNAGTGATAGSPPPPPPPPPPAPTAIYMDNSAVKIIRAIPTTNNSPGGEGPNNAFDNNSSTKYLNFDKKNAGVTVQLNTGKVVTGFTVTTANDFQGRDPTSYKLYGSNDGSTWTLIKQDSLSLSDNRFTTSSTISVANTTAYAYYFMLFPTTKAGDGCGLNCDSMQVAEITYYYDANSTTTSTASSNTIVDPVTAAANTLCCGGSAASFNAEATNTAKVQAFLNRTTNDSRVYIEQIGNMNTITVNQSGTRQNYAGYHGNGSSNNITINQSGNSNTQANYTDVNVTGNTNTVNITQQSTGGGKGAFVNVQNNNHSVVIQQKDSGSHYAEIAVSGSPKSVDVTQQGSASHMARINLSGLTQDLTLTQSGSTQQFYSITSNCVTAGGCARITVNQGQ
jgi:hypothetical protein